MLCCAAAAAQTRGSRRARCTRRAALPLACDGGLQVSERTLGGPTAASNTSKQHLQECDVVHLNLDHAPDCGQGVDRRFLLPSYRTRGNLRCRDVAGGGGLLSKVWSSRRECLGSKVMHNYRAGRVNEGMLAFR